MPYQLHWLAPATELDELLSELTEDTSDELLELELLNIDEALLTEDELLTTEELLEETELTEEAELTEDAVEQTSPVT